MELKNTLQIFKKTAVSLLVLLFVMAWGSEVQGQFILAEDEADNYTTWTAGSNEGHGFLPWVFNSDGDAGHFMATPAEGGISGMTDPVFVLYANGADTFADADRPFRQPLPVGATFSFQWGVNFDSDRSDGNKGINLYTGGTGGTEVININQGNSATITINGSPMFSIYGTEAITFNFERVSGSELRVFATGRDGSENYDQTFNIGDSAIDAVRFYAANLNDDPGNTFQRRPYIDSFTIETDDFANVPVDAQVRFTEDFTLSEDKTLNRVLIDDGVIFTASDATPRTLSITTGGSLTNNGTFEAENGTVNFEDTGTATGTITFNNIELAGGVVLGDNATIGNELVINEGGFIVQSLGGSGADNEAQIPNYLSGSTLVFTGVFTAEGNLASGWGTSTGKFPTNLEVRDGGDFTFQLSNRTIPGDLNVRESSSFSHNSGDNQVTFNNVNIDEGGNLTLENVTRPDLRLTGNFTNNGTFSNEGGSTAGALIFIGSNEQTINNANPDDNDLFNVFIRNNTTVEGSIEVSSALVVGDTGTPGVTLTLKSGNSYIFPSTIDYQNGGAIRFERLINSPDYSESDGHWVVLSSPIAGSLYSEGVHEAGEPFPEEPLALLSNIWTQGFPGANDPRTNISSNVLIYDETDTDGPGEDDMDQRFTRPGSNTIGTGTGFFAYLFENKILDDNGTNVFDGGVATFSVTGQVNRPGAVFDFGPTYSGSSSDQLQDGWNLFGNPYEGALDWTTTGITEGFQLSEISNFAYIYDPEEEAYYPIERPGDDSDPIDSDRVIDGVTRGPYISPFQAFFVKANADNPSLTVALGARTLQTDNAGLFNQNENPLFTLNLQAGESNSATAFRFKEAYSETFSNTDAYYLTPMSGSFAYVYSIKQNRPASVNSLPEDISEPLDFSIGAGAFANYNFYSGEATFTWPVFENIPSEWGITLTDNHTGEVINLRDQDSYSFHMSPGLLSSIDSYQDLLVEGSPVMNPEFAGDRFVITIDPDVATSGPIEGELPKKFAMNQNYPNPFNPTTQIQFDLPETSDVRIDVYNINGQRVATVLNETRAAGTHSVTFDGSRLSSGVYLYRMTAGSHTFTKKMTLIK